MQSSWEIVKDASETIKRLWRNEFYGNIKESMPSSKTDSVAFEWFVVLFLAITLAGYCSIYSLSIIIFAFVSMIFVFILETVDSCINAVKKIKGETERNDD